MTINSIKKTQKSLVINWSSGLSSNYLWRWLKDHSERQEDLHPATLQRQIDIFSQPIDYAVNDISVDKNNAQLCIHWMDESRSDLSFDLLRLMAAPEKPRPEPPKSAELWHGFDEIANPPTMDYDTLMNEDDGIKTWLGHIQRVGFVLLKNSPVDAKATEEMMQKISYLRNSIFGDFSVWDNQVSNPDDTAYTSLEIEPHTDGTYVHDAPGLQTLHCLERNATGGDNQLIDGFAIANEMQKKHPTEFEILSRISVPARYIGDNINLKAHRPVFRTNLAGEVLQVSFNNHDRAPFRLEDDEMECFYNAYGIFHHLANQKQRQFQLRLEPGTILTYDNWRLLHGRAALSGYRKLCGGYHNREDFESRLRTEAN